MKVELPAAQLELSLPPAPSVSAAVAGLAAGRRDLAAAAAPFGRLAAAGVHPFASPLGELNPGEPYDARPGASTARWPGASSCARCRSTSPWAARSARSAVYNALRPWLPAIAALAANAPYHDGRDTGMASVRPKLSELLPRQGIPPAISSWEAFADALRWGAASGAVPTPGRWWWELRPHPAYGTLEVRVPDAQATRGRRRAR